MARRSKPPRMVQLQTPVDSSAGVDSAKPFPFNLQPPFPPSHIAANMSASLDPLVLTARGQVSIWGNIAIHTAPAVTIGALLDLGDETAEGVLVLSVGEVWRRLLPVLATDPAALQLLDWRQWEEMLAGIVKQMDFDEVVLTPRRGDKGRDVIAVRKGFGAIRLLGQMKANSPGRPVTADEVRSMLGVMWDPKASKGIIATTSTFAPEVMLDETIANNSPYRLELLDGNQLRSWMDVLAKRGEK